MLRASLLAATLLSTIVALVGAEMLGRAWLRGLGDPRARPPAPSMLAVPIHPYLVFGAQYGWFEDAHHEAMLAREGPAAFGYRPAAGTYIYDFDRPVDGIADRGSFLFDDQALADQPAADALRLFVVGASVARGVGASSPDQAWHAELARMLTDALGREVRVISAAVDGFVSTQERLVLNLMVLPRCPDAVVIVDGFNDAAMPAMFGVRPGDPINQGLLYRRFYATADGLMRLIADHSAVVRYLWHTRMMDALDENRRRIAGSDAAIAHYGRSTAAVYLDNVSRMLARCRQRGVPCAAFVQPARSLLPAPSRAGGSAWAEQETLERASYAAIRTRLGEKKHDGVHDLSRVFGRTGRSWFYDPVHFGDRGQQAFAKATLPAVLAMLGGDLRPPGATRCEQ